MSWGLVVHLLFTLIVQTKVVGGGKHVGWYSVDINQCTVPESEVKPLCHTYFGSFPYLCRAPDVGDHDDSNTDSGQIKVPQHPCPNWILLPEVVYKRIFWGKMSICYPFFLLVVSGAASSLLGQNYCEGGGASFSTFPTMERKVIRQSIF